MYTCIYAHFYVDENLKEHREMYSKKTQGWQKHMDFMLIDVVSLNISFVLAYITRHGLNNPYGSLEYINLAIVYTLVDFLVLVQLFLQ